MIIRGHGFTLEWLDHFKQQKTRHRIDEIILEKMIHALHLVELLRLNGFDFIFKGGTSLVLLLAEFNRFSIDVDVICKAPRASLEETLDRVITASRFGGWELDEHLSYQPGVPKAHYKFTFDTLQSGSGSILPGVLIEDPVYPQLLEVPVDNKWIATDGKPW